MESDAGFQTALKEAKQGASEGGIPIGACLVSAEGKILGSGHNMRVQRGSAVLRVRHDYFPFAPLFLSCCALAICKDGDTLHSVRCG